MRVPLEGSEDDWVIRIPLNRRETYLMYFGPLLREFLLFLIVIVYVYFMDCKLHEDRDLLKSSYQEEKNLDLLLSPEFLRELRPDTYVDPESSWTHAESAFGQVIW